MTQNRVHSNSWGRPHSEKADSCSMCECSRVRICTEHMCKLLINKKKQTFKCKFPAILNLYHVSDRDEMHKQNIYKQHKNTEIKQETKKTRTVREKIINLSYFSSDCLKDVIHSTFLLSDTPILKAFHHQILTARLIHINVLCCISQISSKSKACEHMSMFYNVF